MKCLSLIVVFCCLSFSGYTQCQTTYSNITEVACDTFVSPNSQIFTNSGVYNDTIINSSGCDSVITIALTVNQSIIDTVSAYTCGNPYISDIGTSYCCTGLYIENYATINGCDSIIYLDIVIGISGDNWIDIVACDQYTSDSDSVYTQSGNYNESFIDIFGCDSIIMYTITIITIDTTITQGAIFSNSAILTSNAVNAAYQWIDCNDEFTLLPNSNNQSFTAFNNGDYACIITENGCSDTSECITVATIGMDQSLFSQVQIYPNPTTDIVKLELGQLKNTSIKVFDITNKLVYQENNINSSTLNFELKEPAGIYIVEVNSEGKTRRFKLVKE